MPSRSLVAAAVAALAVPLIAVVPAGSAPVTDLVVTKARAFVVSKQLADGGFEVAGSPLFETPDAIVAVGGLAQSGPAWSAPAAQAAVRALVKSGHNPLDYVDARVDGEPVPAHGSAAEIALAARTAKIIALVAAPLGISATDFDPSDNSPAPVNLRTRMDAVQAVDGSYTMPGQLNGVLYVVLADWGTGVTVPAAVVAQIKAAQKGDGSWDYSGDPTGTGNDIDTTALALLALRRAGLSTADPALSAGVGFLAAQQDATTGSWKAFGSSDPNSTAMATLALSTLGFDVTTRAWRDAAAPGRTGQAYVAPMVWERSQQAADGHIVSPNDSFGPTPNTFATSQALQALSRSWYTSPERQRFVDREAAVLTTKWVTVPGTPTAADRGVASTALGVDPSALANRGSAVHATLGSDDYRRAVAAELFERSLGRSTDPSGETYWADRLATITRQAMMAQLIASNEFFTKAGSTDAGFVDRAYRTVFFGRSPDSAGRTYWVGKLASGTPRTSVAASLLASSEYRAKETGAQYQRLLGRAVDAGARSYWTDRLRTVRIEALIQALAESREFYVKAIG